ncbi:MAG TPA: sigma-54-dependent Fis family transcriptional regulator [Anaeromyxobacter sp.]|nr:sigma-54-dependent Fis family transcriptional regulator [Anaeromyxobacter sp.]
MSSRNIASGKRAWERYVEGDVVDQRLVRAEVANSWRRCRELHVDPLHQPDGAADQSRSLQDRLYQKQQLLRVARPFLQDLSHFVSGTAFQVVLADEEGLLLESLGDAGILLRTKRVNLCPGMNWSEATKGTNAIGTALVERKPTQIYAWEHFCEGNQFLTCSAAPIADASGNLVAVLDVSGESSDFSPHTLGMVVAAARAIENQLRLEQTSHRLYLMSRYTEALSQGISDGLIAVDGNGVITEVNARGGEILGMSPSQAKGSNLQKVCGDRAPLLRAMAAGEEGGSEELLVDQQGRKVRGAAAALRDERGGVVGAVALFHEVADRQAERRPAAPRGTRYRFDDIVGTSPAISAARERARQAAASSSTVLVLGESGSGKELFVNAIHEASARAGRPLVAINCASLPESLIESELFGYAEGSFTGARKGGQAGKFEIANGGTIFLDEIGDMSPNVQAKLLRVLQERKVARIGSAVEVPVDIRVVAATHRDLRAEAERGRFREDLYYRLAVLEIVVPPLRDRLEDIPFIVERIVARLAARLGRPPARVEGAFLDKLCAYGWPGNVRELENVLERAINRAGDGSALSVDLLELPGDRRPAVAPREQIPRDPQASVRSLRDMEKQAIAEALSACGGNVLKAAQKLGIGRNTLYRKIERYKLAPPETLRRSARGPAGT